MTSSARSSASAAPVALATFAFEVVPAGTATFEPFALDVPSMSGEGFAARRAWWSVFHLLGPQGIEPEEYVVRELLEGDVAGRLVTSGGFAEEVTGHGA